MRPLCVDCAHRENEPEEMFQSHVHFSYWSKNTSASKIQRTQFKRNPGGTHHEAECDKQKLWLQFISSLSNSTCCFLQTKGSSSNFISSGQNYKDIYIFMIFKLKTGQRHVVDHIYSFTFKHMLHKNWSDLISHQAGGLLLSAQGSFKPRVKTRLITKTPHLTSHPLFPLKALYKKLIHAI